MSSMELYAIGAGALLFLWWMLSRKSSKKAELQTDGKIRPPAGPRLVGPNDFVIPEAALLQRGRMEFERDIIKAMQRAARGGTEGAARAEGEDETPSSPPEH
jgi:hypothetical protein